MLVLAHITKKYADNTVLSDVSLHIEKGKIHALVGLNGSGKTTLLNILFGNPHISDTGGFSGDIILDGKKITVQNPKDAIAHGFGMVHQEISLFQNFTLAENITMGKDAVFSIYNKSSHYFSPILKNKNTQTAQKAFLSLGLKNINTDSYPESVSLSLQQLTEIAREVNKNNLKLILLDEPTALLNPNEVEQLFSVLKKLSLSGTAVLYTSHRLDEVMSFSDTVTVLQYGKITAHYTHNKSLEKITQAMTDSLIISTKKDTFFDYTKENEIILSLKNFSSTGLNENINELSLDIYKGEIIGIAAPLGHGKYALAHALMGDTPTSGSMYFESKKINKRTPRTMLKLGFAAIPEDRKQAGLLKSHSILENIVLPALWIQKKFLRKIPFLPMSFLDKKKALEFISPLAKKLHIVCKSFYQNIEELSGGNQQKVLIAQTLALEPKVLLVSEITRGIDLKTKEQILDILLDFNKNQQCTLLISSSELDELYRICDRVLILKHGEIVETLYPAQIKDNFLLHYARTIQKYQYE